MALPSLWLGESGGRRGAPLGAALVGAVRGRTESADCIHPVAREARALASSADAVDAVQRVARQTLPATITTSFQGDGPGIHLVAQRPLAPARARGAGHLHRARHPVELRAPDHNP